MARDKETGEWLTCENCGRQIRGGGTKWCSQCRTLKNKDDGGAGYSKGYGSGDYGYGHSYSTKSPIRVKMVLSLIFIFCILSIALIFLFNGNLGNPNSHSTTPTSTDNLASFSVCESKLGNDVVIQETYLFDNATAAIDWSKTKDQAIQTIILGADNLRKAGTTTNYPILVLKVIGKNGVILGLNYSICYNNNWYS